MPKKNYISFMACLFLTALIGCKEEEVKVEAVAPVVKKSQADPLIEENLERAGLKVLWKSPAIEGETIVACYPLGDSIYLEAGADLYSFSKSNVLTKWKVELPGQFELPPLLNEERLLFIANNNLYAIDIRDGGTLWRKSLDFAPCSPPVIHRAMVLIGGFDKRMHAVNYLTGNEMWKFPCYSNISAPAAGEGEQVFFGDEGNRAYAVFGFTGKEHWRVRTDGAIEAGLIVSEDTLYVGSKDFKIYAFDVATGVSKWSRSTGSPILETPFLKDRILFVPSYLNGVFAIDKKDGKELWWIPEAKRAVAVGEKSLCLTGIDSTLLVANKQTGEVLGRFNTKDYPIIPINQESPEVYLVGRSGNMMVLTED